MAATRARSDWPCPCVRRADCIILTGAQAGVTYFQLDYASVLQHRQSILGDAAPACRVVDVACDLADRSPQHHIIACIHPAQQLAPAAGGAGVSGGEQNTVDGGGPADVPDAAAERAVGARDPRQQRWDCAARANACK